MRIAYGVGIVGLLAVLAWFLLTEPTVPREAAVESNPLPARSAAEGQDPIAAAPIAEPPLRKTAAPILLTPPGDGPLLRVRARDPYGVLDTPHRIWVRQGKRNTEPEWIRDGDVLATRLEAGSPPPERLFLFFERPDHPLARARCTPSTQDTMEGFEAELDLESGVAVVRVTVRDADVLPSGVWTADVLKPIWLSPLEFRASATEPVTILAPAEGSMVYRFHLGSRITFQTSMPLSPGQITHRIQVPDDAVRE